MSRPKTLVSGNTLYWVIRLYDSAGELVDADSTPTVAVRKNGASVADSVTVTKRAATTGIYDCSYNPAGETEGDQYTIEESATISSTTYQSSWEFHVVASASDIGTAFRDNAINITPLSAGVEQRVNGTNITLYLNEVKDTMISITDSEGTAIDLSALTLELAIEDHAGTDIQVIADANITISGGSSNNATFTNTAAVTASERVLHWALRDVTTGSEVLARGLINVKRAADGD